MPRYEMIRKEGRYWRERALYNSDEVREMIVPKDLEGAKSFAETRGLVKVLGDILMNKKAADSSLEFKAEGKLLENGLVVWTLGRNQRIRDSRMTYEGATLGVNLADEQILIAGREIEVLQPVAYGSKEVLIDAIMRAYDAPAIKALPRHK